MSRQINNRVLGSRKFIERRKRQNVFLNKYRRDSDLSKSSNSKLATTYKPTARGIRRDSLDVETSAVLNLRL